MLCVLPFMPQTSRFLFHEERTYDNSLILFLDIEPLNDFDNMYYKNKILDITARLENQELYTIDGLNINDIFGNFQLDGRCFDKYLYNLKEFTEYCYTELNLKTFVVLKTTQLHYELFLNDYDIRKVINIGRLYGFVNDDINYLSTSSSHDIINSILIKKNQNDIIKIFDSW